MITISNYKKKSWFKFCKGVLPLGALFFLMIPTSCKKFIAVDPPFNKLTSGNVYLKDATAAAVLTDIYASMSSGNNSLTSQNISTVTLFAGLSADELTLFASNNSTLANFYRNSLTIGTGIRPWNAIYPYIFKVHNALEGLNMSNSLTFSVKQQLLGEAYFLRAFFYFYLVNLYGDVPLVLSTDWKTNSVMGRAPQSQVYQQVINDLKAAQNLLNENYLDGTLLNTTIERVRPNKWAATALLARVYLYTRDWANAEIQATALISNTNLFNAAIPLNNVFEKNSEETIWALQPVGFANSSNTGEGKLFILPVGGPNANNNPVYLSNYIVNAFESGDLRKTNWTDSVKPSSTAYYYAKKYKIGNTNTPTQEYPIILRLAEQYLIRAEARARLGSNLPGAIADLDVIRNRAGLPLIATINPGISQAALIDKILHERQVELFTEWGHRWLDLKRTGTVDALMTAVTPVKANGSPWTSTQAWYPIPQTDINNNPNLVQNAGY